jgi:hypothetical protein
MENDGYCTYSPQPLFHLLPLEAVLAKRYLLKMSSVLGPGLFPF